ncbi:Spc97 / Spc98 family [Musa troglodytarum]|uniref:Spc97 / Spc98 family n=1 Tax=Musa troglodytarum TaxID=320322 RepID=A0A9E7LF52_9LILI|nr:Spc97 / Spc98 family [Musa troglodytarum]URE48335.1 Spc97 / Spc98 family [Musa troglodytarum]
MAAEYHCCEANFFIHILIIALLVLFAGLMSGLTLGLMSLSLVDLEVLAKVDDPWVPPKTWESIPSESGRVRSADSCGESQDPIYESSLISESNLVHLVVNALLGESHP